jgi:pyruvate dehydrogenase E2 component (dihydrolipoamide acetyltransferase)
VSPIARRVAERLGVDVALVKGTGRNGRVSKEDVEAFAQRAAGARAAPAEDTADASAVRRIRMSARRGVIGRRLLESTQSIPHYRLSVDVDFGALLERRREHLQATNMPTTVNAWLLRAAGLALVQHPLVNAQLEGDEILQFPNADIAVAVATEAGLVTPILRSANLKPVGVIALECRELVQRARLGTLQREDITGGSFTISNLGMQGVDRFDAIINAPQVAILAVGSVAKRPVVRGNALGIADIGTLTLSADHRVIDGAVGAFFMKTLVDLIERPESLDAR